MKNEHIFLPVVLAFCVTGCSPDASTPDVTAAPAFTRTPAFTALPTSAPTITPTLTPTSTPTPTIPPAVIAVWEGRTVEEVCVRISQHFPQFEGEERAVSLFGSIRQVLAAMGMAAREDGDGCEMTIDIDFEGRASAEKYYPSSGGSPISCYAGASIDGTLRAEAEGYDPIEVKLRGTHSPDILTGGCAEEPTFSVGWFSALDDPILGGFAEIWGFPAVLGGLKTPAFEDAGVRLVEKYGPAAADAAPLLIAMLAEAGSNDRAAIVRALGGIGPAAYDAVPLLVELYEKELKLMYGEPETYGSALYGITGLIYSDEDIGLYLTWWELYRNPDREPIVEALHSDPDPKTRLLAAEVLVSKYGADVLPELIGALEDPDEDFRIELLYLLADMGPAAADAVPAVIPIYDGEWASVEERNAAEFALKRIGTAAIPPLIDIVDRTMDTCGEFDGFRANTLDLLGGITGIEIDIYTTSCSVIQNFLDRCQAYYDQHSGD